MSVDDMEQNFSKIQLMNDSDVPTEDDSIKIDSMSVASTSKEGKPPESQLGDITMVNGEVDSKGPESEEASIAALETDVKVESDMKEGDDTKADSDAKEESDSKGESNTNTESEMEAVKTEESDAKAQSEMEPDEVDESEDKSDCHPTKVETTAEETAAILKTIAHTIDPRKKHQKRKKLRPVSQGDSDTEGARVQNEPPPAQALESPSPSKPPPVQATHPRQENRRRDKKKRVLDKDKLPPVLAQFNPEVEDDPKYQPSKEILAALEKEYVFSTRKKQGSGGQQQQQQQQVKAKYLCKVCNYHCDTVRVTLGHICDARHQRLRRTKDLEVTLAQLPPVSESHVEHLTSFLEEVAKEKGLTTEERQTRAEVVHTLKKRVEEKMPGCTVRLYGSSSNGFGLKESDVNIDLNVPAELGAAKMLVALHDLLAKECEDHYEDVEKNFGAKIPIIHFRDKESGLRCSVSANNNMACQTTRLLASYTEIDPRVSKLGVVLRYWAKLCEIDQQEKGTLASYTYSLMLIYFLQQHEPPVLPVLHELSKSEEADAYLAASELTEDLWKCKNTHSLGRLWLSFFEFYSLYFFARDNVVCLRQHRELRQNEKKWGSKLGIEDPFATKTNLSRSVSSAIVVDYITERFKVTYKYFGTPQTKDGEAFGHIVKMERERRQADGVGAGGRKRDRSEEDQERDGVQDRKPDGAGTNDKVESMEVDGEGAKPIEAPPEQQKNHVVTPSEAQRLARMVKPEDLYYSFLNKIFTGAEKPPQICGACQKEGHLKSNCPEDDLPPLEPLPPVNLEFMKRINHICLEIFDECNPGPMDMSNRRKVLHQLQSYINNIYPDAQLELFGSSCNGFGFPYSDMDICLTFTNNEQGEDLDFIKIIKNLAVRLRAHQDFRNVVPITTAKVPIVKFSHYQTRLDGDISLYNTLAQHNTRMLHTYACIDNRVRMLGYNMKCFAKVCDICDASRGSLSSYAYILMVLHFLQQRNPPVIPVLQELYDPSGERPEVKVDDWNAWFMDDLGKLRKLWPHIGENQETVGELWVGLLRYYTEEFNYKEHVITIRQKAPLTRFEKFWNSKCIAIEDPFELTHNLGGGLSRKMNTYIIKSFRRGRLLFGNAIPIIPGKYDSMKKFLFDPNNLCDGKPPNDRGCRQCGKIGHLIKYCPLRRRRQDQRDRDQDNGGENSEDEGIPAGVGANRGGRRSPIRNRRGDGSNRSPERVNWREKADHRMEQNMFPFEDRFCPPLHRAPHPSFIPHPHRPFLGPPVTPTTLQQQLQCIQQLRMMSSGNSSQYPQGPRSAPPSNPVRPPPGFNIPSGGVLSHHHSQPPLQLHQQPHQHQPQMQANQPAHPHLPPGQQSHLQQLQLHHQLLQSHQQLQQSRPQSAQHPQLQEGSRHELTPQEVQWLKQFMQSSSQGLPLGAAQGAPSITSGRPALQGVPQSGAQRMPQGGTQGGPSQVTQGEPQRSVPVIPQVTTQGGAQGVPQGEMLGVVKGVTQGTMQGIPQSTMPGLPQGMPHIMHHQASHKLTQGMIHHVGVPQAALHGFTQAVPHTVAQGIPREASPGAQGISWGLHPSVTQGQGLPGWLPYFPSQQQQVASSPPKATALRSPEKGASLPQAFLQGSPPHRGMPHLHHGPPRHPFPGLGPVQTSGQGQANYGMLGGQQAGRYGYVGSGSGFVDPVNLPHELRHQPLQNSSLQQQQQWCDLESSSSTGSSPRPAMTSSGEASLSPSSAQENRRF